MVRKFYRVLLQMYYNNNKQWFPQQPKDFTLQDLEKKKYSQKMLRKLLSEGITNGRAQHAKNWMLYVIFEYYCVIWSSEHCYKPG